MPTGHESRTKKDGGVAGGRAVTIPHTGLVFQLISIFTGYKQTREKGHEHPTVVHRRHSASPPPSAAAPQPASGPTAAGPPPARLLCFKQNAVNLNSPPAGFDRAVSVSQELTWNLPQGGQLVKQFLTQSLLGQMETHRTLVLFPQNIRVQNLQVSPAFILKPHLSCATLAMMHVIHCF